MNKSPTTPADTGGAQARHCADSCTACKSGCANIQRNTVQREIILQTVRSLHNHPTAEALYRRVAESHPHISRATVYRNLKTLSDAGLVNHVRMYDGADRYDFQTHQHYHFQCERCGGVFDIDVKPDADFTAAIADTAGFEIHACQTVFSGFCPDCKAAGAPFSAEESR
ncbi:MAG: transcriptional repressor [Oscillospiraceae bacterium]